MVQDRRSTGGDSAAHDHQATRDRLIEVASRLFARETVEGVSIRRITREAHVGAASVHYHFSDKNSLLAAIIRRLGQTVLDEITARAEALRHRPGAPTAVEVVETIAVPYFELLEREPVRGAEWLKIVAQLAQASDERLREPSAEATQSIHGMLARAYPEVEHADRLGPWGLAVNSLLAALGRASSHQSSDSQEPTRVGLVAFLAAGMEATIRPDPRFLAPKLRDSA